MLSRLGRGISRIRWLILVAALVIVALAGYYGIGVLDKLQGISNIIDPNSESTQAQNLLAQKLPTNSTDVLLILKSDRLKVDDPTFQQAATQLYDKLKARPEVKTVE